MDGSSPQHDDDFVHAPDAAQAEYVVATDRRARGRVVVLLVILLLVITLVLTVFHDRGPDCDVKTVHHDGPNAFTTYCLPER